MLREEAATALHVYMPCLTWPNWNLKMLVFVEGGKPENPEKKTFVARQEPTTNSTHIWHQAGIEPEDPYMSGRKMNSLFP